MLTFIDVMIILEGEARVEQYTVTYSLCAGTYSSPSRYYGGKRRGVEVTLKLFAESLRVKKLLQMLFQFTIVLFWRSPNDKVQNKYTCHLIKYG